MTEINDNVDQIFQISADGGYEDWKQYSFRIGVNGRDFTSGLMRNGRVWISMGSKVNRYEPIEIQFKFIKKVRDE